MALEDYIVKTRPTTTAFGFGRAWFAGVADPKWASTLFFSQVMTDLENINNCYQSADPTAEEINSLVDSDGGTLEIPEAAAHVKLQFLGDVLFLFCSNGVWAVIPGQDGFAPDRFIVRKVTADGCVSRDAVVEAEGIILYATPNGINQISFSREGGGWIAQSITEATVDKRYNNITRESLSTLRGVYDRSMKRVHFFTQNENGVINSSLNLALKGPAWYPWSFEEDENFKGRAPFISHKKSSGSGLYVFGTTEETEGNHNLVFCQFNDRKFKDYGANNFNSYLVTAPLTLDNPQFNKNAKYAYTYFEKSETGYVDNGEGLEFNFPSEANLSTRWDWHVSANGGRWSSPQQVYKFNDKGYIPEDVNDTFDDGESVVINRARIHGEGRALSLRFESSDGKDMRLIGYTLPMMMRGED